MPRAVPAMQQEIERYLSGAVPDTAYLRRVGETLAVALNTRRVHDAAEMILDHRMVAVLAGTLRLFAPDIAIYDLPPMLANDDAFAFLPNVDAVLLVAAAGETRAEQLEACEKLLQGNTAFLGVVLNKVEDGADEVYGYGYGYA